MMTMGGPSHGSTQRLRPYQAVRQESECVGSRSLFRLRGAPLLPWAGKIVNPMATPSAVACQHDWSGTAPHQGPLARPGPLWR